VAEGKASKGLSSMKLELKQILREVAEELVEGDLSQDFSIELVPPKQVSHGDLSSDLGFRLAKIIKMPPKACADKVLEALQPKIKSKGADGWIREVQVVGPGFLNFFFKEDYFTSILKQLHTADKSYGNSNAGAGKRMVLEYVSANPTGPLTIAHGRQAVVGDTLARILTAAGYEPHREYYMNDVGRQINLLGKSLQARYAELIEDPSVSFPEEGYQGEYLIDLARQVVESKGKEFLGKNDEATDVFFRDFAKKEIFKGIQEDLKFSRVDFDEIYSEQSFSQSDGPLLHKRSL